MNDDGAKMQSRSGRNGRPSHVLQRPKKVSNPLQAGILIFLSRCPHSVSVELKDIPKRYTRYGSLLLLGPTFATHSSQWALLFESLTESDRTDLFRSIVDAFKDSTLTHVALNAPIAPTKADDSREENNVVRSPTGLQSVYGNFGPGVGECDEQRPLRTDLNAAYWTQTVQLNGIIQVWAPRWTMFSRGNISEKARILQGGLSKSPFPGLNKIELGECIDGVDVVDFYVGIGYFAFCYLARGVARVWGWEINGWSVEGLRKGCMNNRWGVRVIRINESGNVSDGQSITDLVDDIRRLQSTPEALRCIVFWGDNKWASKVMAEVKSIMDGNEGYATLNIRHCNLGLLPSSEDSWEDAACVLDNEKGGWLHVHENVEASAITAKGDQIIQKLQQFTCLNTRAWSILCCHVEQVKTYAPGVVHCVYDIKLYPSK